MKFSKVCCMLAAASLAVGAFADAANVLISFSTKSDYYADGTPVLDGEWYALCWAKDRNFDGITLDCKPVNPDEKILIMAPLAKGGRCPFVVFQVDSAVAPSEGRYFVYLLDTRDATGTKVAEAGENEAGERVPQSWINGAAVSKGFTASSSAGKNRARAVSVTSGVWAESEVVDAKQPRITSFKVEDAKVKITVADMLPGVKYNISMGSSPSEFTSYGLDVPKTVADDPTFELDLSDAKFFRVVRQPLDKPITTDAE